MKVIVAGTRTFSNYELLCKVLNEEIKANDEIVSGTAKGADQLGEKYAKEKGIIVTQFPADWEKYGKAAGYKRNAEMAKYADALIAFWDGSSKGTGHMIDLAKQHSLKIKVVNY